jgi:GH43 family beta-xylosidase
MPTIHFVQGHWYIYHSEGVSGPYLYYKQAARAMRDFR